ncbi:MAG: hypothetical protein H7249_12160 [Chitinophagaceae bacterium]|nr:hypothetical protein [Oligoflexus sp.]
MNTCRQISRFGMLFTVGFITLACAETKFSGGPQSSAVAAASADSVPAPAPSAAPVPVPNVACDASTVIKNSLPPAVSACYESGRVWNFDNSSCVAMRAAAFTCDWDSVRKAMSKIGITSTAIDTAAKSGASRLIGCGQSQDGNRIVVQFVNQTQTTNACTTFKSGDVVTGCFTNYGTSEPPAPTTSKEEQDKRVYACMNQL